LLAGAVQFLFALVISQSLPSSYNVQTSYVSELSLENAALKESSGHYDEQIY
jgi:hypothetical protein